MDKLKGGPQQRFTGVVEAGVLTIWEENGAGSVWRKDTFYDLDRPQS